MSYLNPLRLHFSGRFQASVSTVNNDVTHFNNATFKPEFQQFKVGKEWNGWWNPTGDAVWRLLGCTVTSAFDPQGCEVAAKDPVLKMVVADSDDSAPAKIVDLDPQQQMVSTIFGLRVRIADAGGNTLVSGSMDPAPFTGIWMRAQGKSGDMAMGACFQSVLRDVTWGDIKGSTFLQALKKGSPDNLLSIKFNVDAFNMDVKNPQFCRGRLVGTIGPASAAEPALFTLGRQFMAVFPPQNPMAPSGGINNFTATVDEKGGKVLLDLGNALPTDAATGAMFDVGKLTLKMQVQDPDGSGASVWRDIGDIPYTEAGFYTTKGGVVALPADRRLTAAELKGLRAGGLALFAAVGKTKPVIAIQEPPNGVHVRMDSFVFRLAPRQPEVAPRDGQPYWTARTRLHATRYGQPYADARIIAFQDQSWL